VYFSESLLSLKEVFSTKATNTVYISLNNTEVEVQNTYFQENGIQYIFHIITIAEKSSIYLPELFETVVAYYRYDSYHGYLQRSAEPKILFANKAFCDLVGYS
jgi:PAS domain-containing protein